MSALDAPVSKPSGLVPPAISPCRQKSPSESPPPPKPFRNFSRFSRDPDAWDVLCDEVLPSIAEAKRSLDVSDGADRVIRCWSCGCSTGEEPYYLSMIWDQRFSKEFPEVSFSVLGTDKSQDCIAHARHGVYTSYSVSGLNHAYLRDYFCNVSSGEVRLKSSDLHQVCDRIRSCVAFEVQKVESSMPPGVFDLVLTRYSICLYLEFEILSQVLFDIVQSKLSPTGCLMLGNEESLSSHIVEHCGLVQVAHQCSKKAHLFKRSSGPLVPRHQFGKNVVYLDGKERQKPREESMSRGDVGGEGGQEEFQSKPGGEQLVNETHGGNHKPAPQTDRAHAHPSLSTKRGMPGPRRPHSSVSRRRAIPARCSAAFLQKPSSAKDELSTTLAELGEKVGGESLLDLRHQSNAPTDIVTGGNQKSRLRVCSAQRSKRKVRNEESGEKSPWLFVPHSSTACADAHLNVANTLSERCSEAWPSAIADVHPENPSGRATVRCTGSSKTMQSAETSAINEETTMWALLPQFGEHGERVDVFSALPKRGIHALRHAKNNCKTSNTASTPMKHDESSAAATDLGPHEPEEPAAFHQECTDIIAPFVDADRSLKGTTRVHAICNRDSESKERQPRPKSSQNKREKLCIVKACGAPEFSIELAYTAQPERTKPQAPSPLFKKGMITSASEGCFKWPATLKTGTDGRISCGLAATTALAALRHEGMSTSMSESALRQMGPPKATSDRDSISQEGRFSRKTIPGAEALPQRSGVFGDAATPPQARSRAARQLAIVFPASWSS